MTSKRIVENAHFCCQIMTGIKRPNSGKNRVPEKKIVENLYNEMQEVFN
jgi:hypothetical protein